MEVDKTEKLVVFIIPLPCLPFVRPTYGKKVRILPLHPNFII